MRFRHWLALLACLSSAHAFALDVGRPLPQFSAATLAPRADQPFESRELRGQIALVDFWASWCPPCRLAVPALNDLEQRYAGQGFVVIGVNQDTRLADAERFLKRAPARYRLLQDSEHRIARAFSVDTMPSAYLIDRQGVVRYIHRGFDADSHRKLDAAITQLLKEPQ